MQALKLTWLTASASLAFLSAGQADDQKLLPSSRQSPHFSKVASKLDLGGPIFTYVDVDGDLEGILEFVQTILGSLPPEASLPPEVANLDLNKLAKPLGFHGIKAKGMSSIAKGKDSFHNKLFLYTPAGRKGLLEVLGDKPSTFLSPDLAPANATLVIEQDLHLSKLKDVVNAVVTELGNPDLKGQWNEFLSQPASPWELTAGEFFGKMNTRLTIIVALDQETQLPIPDMPGVSVPAPDILIAMEDAKWIVEGLKKMLPPDAIQGIEKGDGYEQLSAPESGPPPFDIYVPVFRYDEKADRLMVASRKSFLDACLSKSSAKLRSAAPFQTAMTGLPASGNGLIYSTPELLQVVSKTVADVSKQVGQGDGQQMAMSFKLLTALPVPEGVTASVQSNLPDGILMASNSSMSHKMTFYTAGGAPMILAGLAGFATVKQFDSGPTIETDSPTIETDSIRRGDPLPAVRER